MNGFSCATGTALESNTKLQDTIDFHSADHKALYVNLFVPPPFKPCSPGSSSGCSIAAYAHRRARAPHIPASRV